jgi:hypothetical protein
LKGGDVECADDIDLIVLVDGTWSWKKGGKTEMDDQKDSMKKFLKTMGKNVQVGVINYGGWNADVRPMTKDAQGNPTLVSVEDAIKAVDESKYLNGVTWTGAALTAAKEMLGTSTRVASKIVLSPQDHLPRDKRVLQTVVDGIEANGGKVIFVPMGRAWKREKYCIDHLACGKWHFGELTSKWGKDETVLMLPASTTGKSKQIEKIVEKIIPDMCVNLQKKGGGALVQTPSLVQLGGGVEDEEEATSFLQRQLSKLVG